MPAIHQDDPGVLVLGRVEQIARRGGAKPCGVRHHPDLAPMSADERHEAGDPGLFILLLLRIEVRPKAQYLIQLFAATPYGQTPRCKELIAHTLEDLTFLSDQSKELS